MLEFQTGFWDTLRISHRRKWCNVTLTSCRSVFNLEAVSHTLFSNLAVLVFTGLGVERNPEQEYSRLVFHSIASLFRRINHASLKLHHSGPLLYSRTVRAINLVILFTQRQHVLF